MTDSVLILNTAVASTVDLANGTATFLLDQPLQFQDRDPKICVNKFSFTNYFVNISAALANNEFHLYWDDPAPAAPDILITLTIPDGSYSIIDLNTVIQGLLAAYSDGVNPVGFHANCVDLLPNYGANRAYLQFNTYVAAGYYMLMDAGTPYVLLGAALNEKLPAGVGVYTAVDNEQHYFSGPPTFNNIQTINIKTNICNNFIYGTLKSNVLYTTAPTVSPGSVQTDSPANLLWSDATVLRGGTNLIKIDLSDQNDDPLPMTENFLVVLQIRY